MTLSQLVIEAVIRESLTPGAVRRVDGNTFASFIILVFHVVLDAFQARRDPGTVLFARGIVERMFTVMGCVITLVGWVITLLGWVIAVAGRVIVLVGWIILAVRISALDAVIAVVRKLIINTAIAVGKEQVIAIADTVGWVLAGTFISMMMRVAVLEFMRLVEVNDLRQFVQLVESIRARIPARGLPLEVRANRHTGPRREVTRDPDCIVCYAECADTLLMPCKHLVVCTVRTPYENRQIRPLNW